MENNVPMEETEGSIPEEEIDIAAVMSLYPYLDIQDKDYRNMSMGDILEKMQNEEDKPPAYDTLCNAVDNNPEIGDMVLVDQSELSGFDGDLIVACTFATAEEPTDYYVVFRGTGDGKWVDNGIGMTTPMTVMQEEAVEYYEYIIENEILTDENYGNIYLGGHSKGGNNVLGITYFSKYAEMITGTFAFDAQQLSSEAEKEIIDTYGEDFYYAQQEKVYDVCGDKDFVHVLGERGVAEDHVILVETDATGLGGHDMNIMLDGAELRWVRDEEGNIVSAEPGTVVGFVEALSENLNKLPREDYNDCCLSVMSLMEMIMPYDDKIGGEEKFGTGDVKFATVEEFMGFLAYGMPVVLQTLVTTPEGHALLEDIYVSGANLLYDKFGPLGFVLLYIVVTVTIIPILTDPRFVTNMNMMILWFWPITLLYDKITDSIDNWEEVSQQLKDVLENMHITVMDYLNGLLQEVGMGNVSSGVTLPNDIRVDTYKLREYASRLEAVSNKMTELERRLKALNMRTQWSDLQKFLQRNSLASENWRIRRCVEYLNSTADDFEMAEKEIEQLFS